MPKLTLIARTLLFSACALDCSSSSMAQEISLPQRMMGYLITLKDDPLGAEPRSLAPVGNCASSAELNQVTLRQIIHLALCNLVDVKQARAEIERQIGAVGEAKSAYLPTLNVGLSKSHNEVVSSDEFRPESKMKANGQTASLNFRLFDSGVRSYRLKASRAQLDAALAGSEEVRINVIVRAARVYNDALSAQASLHSDQETVNANQLIVQTTAARQARSVASAFDTQQANLSWGRAVVALEKSRAAYEKSLQDIAFLTGTIGQQPVTLAAHEFRATTDEASLGEIDARVNQLIGAHPAVVGARDRLEAAMARLRSTHAEGLPTMDFAINRYLNGRPGQTLSAERTKETLVTVSVNVPLFEGFGRIYKNRAANADVISRRAELDDVELRVRADLAKARIDLSSAHSILTANSKLVQSTVLALESARTRFERGVGDMVEVLNLTSERSRANKDEIQARADLQKARISLFTQVGRADMTGLLD